MGEMLSTRPYMVDLRELLASFGPGINTFKWESLRSSLFLARPRRTPDYFHCFRFGFLSAPELPSFFTRFVFSKDQILRAPYDNTATVREGVLLGR